MDSHELIEQLKTKPIREVSEVVNLSDAIFDTYIPNPELLGRLEVMRFCELFKASINGDEFKSPFDESVFYKALSRITHPFDMDIYEGFTTIHSWLLTQHYAIEGAKQKALNALNAIERNVERLNLMVKVNHYSKWLPYTMGRKDFKAFSRNVEKNLEGRKEAPITVFAQAFNYYLKLFRSYPRRANPLRDLREQLEGKAITDPIFLKSFSDKYGWGDLVFPDGTKASTLTPKRLEKRLKTHAEERYTFFYQTVIDSIKEQGYVGVPVRMMGGPYENNDGNLKWVGNTGDIPPNVLDQWRLFSRCYLVILEYPALVSVLNEEISKKERLSSLLRLAKYYPSFFNAFKDDMEAKFPLLRNIPLSDWDKPCLDSVALYKRNFYDFTNFYRFEALDKRGCKRGGLAIYIGSPTFSDEAMHYEEPNLLSFFSSYSGQKDLRGFITGENLRELSESMANDYKALNDSLEKINAINRAITVLSRSIGMVDIEVFLADLGKDGELQHGVDHLNHRVALLFLDAKRFLDDKHVDKKKFQALGKAFPYVKDVKRVVINKDSETKAIGTLKEYGNIKRSIYEFQTYFYSI